MMDEKILHDIGHKIGAILERLDGVEQTLEYQTKLMETMVEAIPTGNRPNVMAALKPLLESPLLAANPALAEMVKNFSVNMEGK